MFLCITVAKNRGILKIRSLRMIFVVTENHIFSRQKTDLAFRSVQTVVLESLLYWRTQAPSFVFRYRGKHLMTILSRTSSSLRPTVIFFISTSFRLLFLPSLSSLSLLLLHLHSLRLRRVRVRPLNAAIWVWGSAVSSFSGFGRSPTDKRCMVHFELVTIINHCLVLELLII